MKCKELLLLFYLFCIFNKPSSLNCLTTLCELFLYFFFFTMQYIKNKAYPNEAQISYLWSSCALTLSLTSMKTQRRQTILLQTDRARAQRFTRCPVTPMWRHARGKNKNDERAEFPQRVDFIFLLHNLVTEAVHFSKYTSKRLYLSSNRCLFAHKRWAYWYSYIIVALELQCCEASNLTYCWLNGLNQM